MEGAIHPMHPVELSQVHPYDLRVELDLALDVLGANCEVMNSIRQTHREILLTKRRHGSCSVPPYSILVAPESCARISYSLIALRTSQRKPGL
jgi:hypothetical protein